MFRMHNDFGSALILATNANYCRRSHDFIPGTPPSPHPRTVTRQAHNSLYAGKHLAALRILTVRMAEAPFGWPHRQKRSLTQMQADGRSVSPAWSFGSLHNSHEQPVHPERLSDYRSAQPQAFDYRESQSQSHYHGLDSTFENFSSAPVSQASRPTTRSDSAGASPPLQNAQPAPQVADMASQTPRRFVGDGFDYRRPAGPAGLHVNHSQEQAEDNDGEGGIMVDLSGPENDSVIDLTADDSGYGASQDNSMRHNIQASRSSAHPHGRNNATPRLPRGMDIIIDLDSGAEEWREVTPGSPEIEFISARPLDPHQRRSFWRQAGNMNADDVQFVREQALPENDVRRRTNRDLDHALDMLGILGGNFGHLRAHVDRYNNQLLDGAGGWRGRGPIAPPRAPRAASVPTSSNSEPVRVGAFVAPTLDFGVIGFDMVGMGGARAAEQQPPPTYDAPPKAPDGFTRSPAEQDVLACPNCGDELCVGDDDAKRQVWIVKGCGHVYCGECTANRAVKKSSKGKERPPNTKPFKKCVVEDCERSVVHRKSMIQVFL
ncbi:hypothetical protein IAQ61_005378 [Plenodomus lingam]|uniref:uncharacterized protein n=1 Tax=Leptosphaeria maculans TaxID=5022 RepID=UPI00332B6F7A|nr:hypothetical protein IAQ61_005378 [Plenodomus lingam]